jgi:hypothetical protein
MVTVSSQANENNRWVSKNGQVTAETESQRRLMSTLGFQLRLDLYIRAYKGFFFTAESQRIVLNKEMQLAYEQQDTNVPSIIHPRRSE